MQSADEIRKKLHAAASLGIGNGVFSGCVLLTGDSQEFIVEEIGRMSGDSASIEMPADAIFDLASMSKVIATWTVVCRCITLGLLSLETRVSDVYTIDAQQPTGALTVRQLLTHTAGLPARSNLQQYGDTRAMIERGVLAEPLQGIPGVEVNYTDRAALVLGFLCERVTQKPLSVLAHDIWSDLAIENIFFGPVPTTLLSKTVPGGFDDETGQKWLGVVHDKSTRLLGGTSGIAGCFGSAYGIAEFMNAILAVMRGDQPAIAPEIVSQSLSLQAQGLKEDRGLGWAIASYGIAYHHGFTGSSMWIDPQSKRYFALLTNALEIRRDKFGLSEIRRSFLDIIGE
jgi:CubicO group peptidase (beta-lactamase class C family)